MADEVKENRYKRLFRLHFRGIIGGIGGLICFLVIFMSPMIHSEEYDLLHKTAVKYTWALMFWFFLFQTVALPVTALLPVIIFPVTGVLSAPETVVCYFNDSIALFILMGMIGQLYNQTGIDRRIILKILCCGDPNSFSLVWITVKTSLAAFLLSIVSTNLMVTSVIMEYVVPVFESLQVSTSQGGSEPDFNDVRNIILNGIHTSSIFGSLVFIHNIPSMIAFRCIYTDSTITPYPDIHNYFMYTVFAFPLALTLYIFNLIYHIVLIIAISKKPMSSSSVTEMSNALKTKQSELPKPCSNHELLAVFFSTLILVILMFRYPIWFKGWTHEPIARHLKNVPRVQDSTAVALFVILLHALPKDLSFCKVFTASNTIEPGSLKPTSGVFFWKFIDKNTNYGYILVFGAALALFKAINVGKNSVSDSISKSFESFQSMGPSVSLLILIVMSSILANLMSSVAAATMMLPVAVYMINTWDAEAKKPYWTKPYWAPMAVGMACSFSFMSFFLHTPSHFSHTIGHVSLKNMIKWGLASVAIGVIILWLFVAFYAPMVFGEFKYVRVYRKWTYQIAT